jgi:hypothetical protein
MLAHELCPHMVITREAAGILFAGGFPRGGDAVRRAAAQRAIYHVQLALESMAASGNPALVVCDRGVVDGSAYWPGPEDFWSAVGTTREQALSRYDAVIHLRAPDGPNGYGHQNPLRIETAEEARAIDERILAAWAGHPRRFTIDATPDFLVKAQRALSLIRAEIPRCCVAVRGGSYDATTRTGQLAPAVTDPTTLPSTAGMTRPTP